MISVVQRVTRASVEVDDDVVGAIERGLCVLLGIERGDGEDSAVRMAAKIAKLRIFSDAAGKMNLSVQDIKGAVLVVSQFTLAGDASGGNRPSFINAAPAEIAAQLVDRVAALLASEHALPVATGRFQAHMLVRIENDGPVTIIVRG